jgi:hypothetical protein
VGDWPHRAFNAARRRWRLFDDGCSGGSGITPTHSVSPAPIRPRATDSTSPRYILAAKASASYSRRRRERPQVIEVSALRRTTIAPAQLPPRLPHPVHLPPGRRWFGSLQETQGASPDADPVRHSFACPFRWSCISIKRRDTTQSKSTARFNR